MKRNYIFVICFLLTAGVAYGGWFSGGGTGGGGTTTDASQLTSGTLPAARIGDNTVTKEKLYTTGGTPSATTYFRGDNTWATPDSPPFAADILINSVSAGKGPAGNGNTRFGEGAGTGASGNYNSAFGQYANGGTTGNENTGVGWAALFNIAGGGANTAVGSDALRNAAGSTGNTSVGDWALGNLITGGRNTAVGYQAGIANALDNFDNCTFIGGNSDASVTGLKNSTAIGSGALITDNNQVVIGNAAVTSTILRGVVSVGSSLASDNVAITGGSISGVRTSVTILDNVSGPTAAQSYGSLNVVTANITVLLPTAVAGMSTCVMDSGTAHDIIVDVQATDNVILNGTTQAGGLGVTNASGTSTGDLVCLIATAANKWSTTRTQGTWSSQ